MKMEKTKYSYHEPTLNGDRKVTKTVEEIRKEYYPFWKKQLIEKRGENIDLSFERCLDEWICVHWAYEDVS